MKQWLLKTLPRGLYGRAALIVLLPIALIQLFVSVAFIQRHFEGVTWQMTDGVVLELELLRDTSAQEGFARAQTLASALDLQLALTARMPPESRISSLDIQGRNIAHAFGLRLGTLNRVDTVSDPARVLLWVAWDSSVVQVSMPRARVSATNPNQLLILMLLAGALVSVVAMFFLRRQLSPIAHLARAAEALGKGQIIPYRPRGAFEVRAAGAAFLEMRNRIERQMEQRTLLLSGISHDLRTPLTRMKLTLAMLDDAEATDLGQDVTEMERMIEEFLTFARGGATEAPEPTDPYALLETVVQRAARSGIAVSLGETTRPGPIVMRPAAITRALENLINNAARYADTARASLGVSARSVRFIIEDDGPGIPADRRDEAMRPFTRLDPARNPNVGGGVGLGLSIVADLAHAHGGQLRLSQSEALGGLKAELIISR